MADPIQEFKAKQREGWASFAPLEAVTIPTAAHLVRFAGVRAGQDVLDVGCGTGVAALTARRMGARVTGLDLTPELLARATEHADAAGYDDVSWKEGDAEVMPFPDASFDVVLSQWGHMFAPRPDVVTQEMLRVLRPGGVIAFSTWPPELAVASVFALTGRYSPPLPPGASPPGAWGDLPTVRQRLGDAVRELTFDRETQLFPCMGPSHYRAVLEATAGPVKNLVKAMKDQPERLAQFRREVEEIGARFFDAERNVARHGYLVTRAIKR